MKPVINANPPIVGLDIGTSKIVAVVAVIKDDDQLEMIGFGSAPSTGLRRGVVVNIEATVNAIQAAVAEAELMANCKISRVWAGIAGSHIKSFNSHGMVAIRDREVSQHDIDSVLRTAQAVNIPADQRVLHTLIQEFIIDDQGEVREPLGMSGVRLEVKVHMVTGAVSAAENIVKCVRRCGLEVEELVLQPIASATSVLHNDERDLGVVMVDIGGGTTDIAVYSGGAIRHTAVLPIAGDQITNDIAMALRTPTKDAEELKQQHGYALRQLADSTIGIEVPGVGDRQTRQSSRQTLANVIEPRVEELFALVQAEITRAGFAEGLSSGVVLTGGSAAMPGMAELGEEVFHMPVRIGQPNYGGPLAEFVRHPRYATAVGLVQTGFASHQKREIERIKEGPFKAGFRKFTTWVQGNF
ncbi:MAG: cell division protein FtsA [Burkholderiales bacterium]|jgi:cell division protein FtsA|nr:cell division protein FtsA [Betaproteobacteria bacterium]